EARGMRQGAPACFACGKARQPEIENIGETVCVVPGDACAVLSRTHRFEERDAGFLGDVMHLGLTEPARLGMTDGGIGLLRILDDETAKSFGKTFAQVAAPGVERCRGEWCRKQDDAEIGVV